MSDNDIVFPRVEDLPPVDVDQFIFAVHVASAAKSLRMPMESPARFGVTLETETGDRQRFKFTDIPENRMLLAVRQHFGANTDTFMSAAMRLFALIRVFKSEGMAAWTRRPSEPDGTFEIHDAVLKVAATMPLNREGYFEEVPFFAKVAEVAGQEPGDEHNAS